MASCETHRYQLSAEDGSKRVYYTLAVVICFNETVFVNGFPKQVRLAS